MSNCVLPTLDGSTLFLAASSNTAPFRLSHGRRSAPPSAPPIEDGEVSDLTSEGGSGYEAGTLLRHKGVLVVPRELGTGWDPDNEALFGPCGLFFTPCQGGVLSDRSHGVPTRDGLTHPVPVDVIRQPWEGTLTAEVSRSTLLTASNALASASCRRNTNEQHMGHDRVTR